MTKARSFALVRSVLALFGIAAASPASGPLAAQTPCRAVTGSAASRPAPLGSRDAAHGPLARTFSLQAGEVTLRAALDLVAEAARVRLSYSGDLLPLDARVCATWESATVAGALAYLLGDVPVQPVVAGDDHLVLAPARAASVAQKSPVLPSEPIYRLDEIIAQGSLNGAASRGDPVARSVVSGTELENRGIETLAGALNTVPGVWTWGGGSDITTRFGSLRGASSFGVSAPKVYIDGIEAASPLLVSRILPGTVERIEVIRGPQGAGLYGADAIGGVVNVVTRKGAGGPAVPRAQLQSRLGSSSSLYSPEVAVSQDHTLSLRTGTKGRNASLDFGLGTAGNHVPGAASRHVSAVGSARLVGDRSLLDATARFSAEGTRLPRSPLLSGFGAAPASVVSEEQSLQQYTLGLTGSLTTGQWTHSATVGVDGYALDGAAGLAGPLSSAADSALRAASGTASRSTLRLSTVGRFDLSGGNEAALTFTAERSALAQRTAIQTTPAGTLGRSAFTSSLDELASSRTGYGLGARADASWGNRFFVSSGVRLERTDAVVGLGSMTALPMMGAAAVEDFGPFTVKLRAAYGRGIRWPQLAPVPGVPASVMSDAVFVGLSPEVQSGVEGGLDLSLGEVASLHVTRFDQTARGLLQRVTTSGGGSGRGGPGRNPSGYRFQNVGEIGNRGWELQGSLSQGPLSLGASLSFVDSRVLRLAGDYTGDLREGDRPLEVPARTLGLTAQWQSGGWLASLTASRASDWINYDRLGLARDLASSGSAAGDLTGERLRTYWRPYDGVTHLGATVSRDLFRRFTLTLAGDNLLGHQVGEPDNITVLPGRTLRIGVRASF